MAVGLLPGRMKKPKQCHDCRHRTTVWRFISNYWACKRPPPDWPNPQEIAYIGEQRKIDLIRGECPEFDGRLGFVLATALRRKR